MAILAETRMRFTPPDARPTGDQILGITETIARNLFRVSMHLADGEFDMVLVWERLTDRQKLHFRSIARQAVMSVNPRLVGLAESHAVETARERLIRDGECDEFREIPVELLDTMGSAVLDIFAESQLRQWDGVTK